MIPCLLVGGDEGRNKKRIVPLLESMNIQVVDMWDMEAKIRDLIPNQVDFVVLLTDLCSHNLYDNTKALAKRYDIPIVMTPGQSTVLIRERVIESAERWAKGNKYGLGHVLSTIEEQMKKTYPPKQEVNKFLIQLFTKFPYISNKDVKEHGDVWVATHFPGDTFPVDPGVLASTRTKLGIKKSSAGIYPTTPPPEEQELSPNLGEMLMNPEPKEVVLEAVPEEHDKDIPADVREAAEMLLTYMREHNFTSFKMSDDGVVDFTQRVIRHGKWQV